MKWRNKPPRQKRRFIHLVVFSIANLLIIAVAALFIGVVVFIESIGQHGRMGIPFILLIFCVIWIISGSCVSAFWGRRSWTPVLNLLEAFKEVSKGNFDVELKEELPVPELANVSKSFNKMVRELGRTETVHNDFVANVSHEFKTPIAAIEGYATLLQDESLTKSERDEYISKILSNTVRLSTLTGNILKIARLEKQEIVLEKNWFSLDEQIRQALISHENRWGEKNIEVDIDLDSQQYYWNEELLMQVWVNIFDNAVKFTPENGTILARMRKMERSIVVEISDTGVGMNEETAKHIFVKFYQGDKSHYSHGNGLGLTLVKRIVDLCGGGVRVQSTPGEGSTFVVELPLCDNESDSQSTSK